MRWSESNKDDAPSKLESGQSCNELFPRDCIKPGIATAGLNGSSTCLRGNCGPVVSAELILAEVGVTYCKLANKRLKSTRSPNLLRRGFSILTALSACMQTGDDLDHMLSSEVQLFLDRRAAQSEAETGAAERVIDPHRSEDVTRFRICRGAGGTGTDGDLRQL